MNSNSKTWYACIMHVTVSLRLFLNSSLNWECTCTLTLSYAMDLLLRFLYTPYQLLKKYGIKGPTPTPFFGHYKERVKMVRMPPPILPFTPHPQPSLVSQHCCRCDVMVVILCTRTLPPPPISRMCWKIGGVWKWGYHTQNCSYTGSSSMV